MSLSTQYPSNAFQQVHFRVPHPINGQFDLECFHFLFETLIFLGKFLRNVSSIFLCIFIGVGAGGVAVAPGPVGVGGGTPQVWSASLTSAPDTGGGWGGQHAII